MSHNSESDTEYNPLGDSEDETEDDQKNSLNRTKLFDPVNASCKAGRLRTSKHWTYFEIDTHQNGIALCKFCHSEISYKTTISNLGKHLNRKHLAELESNILPKPLPERISKDDPNETETLDSKKVHVMTFFDKIESDQLRCKTCGIEFSDNDSTYLLKHGLSHDKQDIDGKTESFLEDSGNETETVKRRPGRVRSMAWKHFTVVDSERKFARCKICKKVFSYATSVSNLRKHVIRAHAGNLQATNDDSYDLQHSTSEVSPVWAYFQCLSKAMKIASCLICKKRVIYSDDCTELMRHLSKKHPNIDLGTSAAGKTFMVTDDGDFYEVQINKSDQDKTVDVSESENDTNEDPKYTNEDFLDDTFDEPEQKVKTIVKRKSYAEHTSPKKMKIFMAPKAKPEQEDDSIDIFGKYIVSLLKTLPKQSAARLQYEFVKQVLLEQNEKAVSEGTMTEEDINLTTSNSDKIPD